MEQGLTLTDVMDAIRRRWPLVAIPAVIGLILAAAVSAVLPPVYLSTARLLVESQQIPSDLARSTVTALAPERIRLIEQRLLTRQNLLEIADNFKIFAGTGMSPTNIVESMRKRIAFDIEALGAQGRKENITSTALSISFEADQPALSARVTNDLVSRVLEQNIRQRNSLASGTLDFFNREVDRLGRELSAIENRIVRFTNDNEGALPDSLAFRREELSKLRDQMFERESRRIAFQEQLRQINEALSRGELGGLPGAVDPAEKELERLRSALVQQRGVYAETHPAIRSLQSRIAVLEATLGAGGGKATGAPVDSARFPPDAERQIKLIEKQLELLDAQLGVDRKHEADLKASIERTPEVDQALNALLRQRESTQTQYQDAVLKRAEAETGERLEVNQQAERFEVIEQAQQPAAPISPNPPLIIAGGAAGGAALGVGLMILLELLNRSIRSPRDLERRARLRPIVTIPFIATAAEEAGRRRRRRMAAVIALVLVPSGLIAVDQLYLPLPLLVERGVSAAGIDTFVRLVEARLAR